MKMWSLFFFSCICKSIGQTMILADERCLRHASLLICSFYSCAGPSTVYGAKGVLCIGKPRIYLGSSRCQQYIAFQLIWERLRGCSSSYKSPGHTSVLSKRIAACQRRGELGRDGVQPT